MLLERGREREIDGGESKKPRSKAEEKIKIIKENKNGRERNS